MVADIEKAFLMVEVLPRDRDALRFLWVKNFTAESPEVIHLRFTRVTFGVNCSPFLLKATIEHHVSSYQDQDPQFVKSFSSSIYVDDLTFGADSEDKAYSLFVKSKARLAEAGFNLRKFLSNSTSLQSQVDSHEQQHQQNTPTPVEEEDQSYAKRALGVKGEESGREEASKVLGVQWRHKKDQLTFNLEGMGKRKDKEIPTKRDVVAEAARVFDPLGVLSPITILWKIFFQTICAEGLDWDQPLTEKPLLEWKKLNAATEGEFQITIPRRYQSEDGQQHRLVGFCDAQRGPMLLWYT